MRHASRRGTRQSPSGSHRRRALVFCGAAVAAALFTPVQATTATADSRRSIPATTVVTAHTAPDVGQRGHGQARGIHEVDVASEQDAQPVAHVAPQVDRTAQLLIATGMIGVGLSLGGLVVVAHQRRRW